jgi:hypothetical protein
MICHVYLQLMVNLRGSLTLAVRSRRCLVFFPSWLLLVGPLIGMLDAGKHIDLHVQHKFLKITRPITTTGASRGRAANLIACCAHKAELPVCRCHDMHTVELRQATATCIIT